MSSPVRRSAADSLLGLWVRTQPGTKMSVSWECCVFQVQVSALGRSLVQRNPTERVVSTWAWSWSLDTEEALAPEGMMRHGKYYISPIFLKGKIIRKTPHTYVKCTEMVPAENVSCKLPEARYTGVLISP